METPPAEPIAPERTPTKAAEAAVDEMMEEAKTKVEETTGEINIDYVTMN